MKKPKKRGTLTILQKFRSGGGENPIWWVKCDCGKIKTANSSELRKAPKNCICEKA